MTKDVAQSKVLYGEYEDTAEARGHDRDRRAAEAWEIIARDVSWGAWLRVADGLDYLRTEALREAGTNRPFGRGYTAAWRRLAETRPYASEVDKKTRSDALWCIDHLPEISEWRESLDVNLRAKFNHPTTVRRRFEKAVNEEAEKETPEPQPGSLIATLKATIRELEAEVSRLEAQIMELEMLIAALKAEIATLKADRSAR